MVKTTIQEHDGDLVAILEGNLDTPAVSETEKAMAPLYDNKGKDIIIDCTDLQYISSGGLRIFLSILCRTPRRRAARCTSRASPPTCVPCLP